jgi:benzoyl-CoA reductase/2-hydroxyglutaryl-CoA dehydratase subunit BcrC/BadD/HgdB
MGGQFTKLTVCENRLGEMRDSYLERLNRAHDEGKLVAAVGATNPIEILVAHDIVPMSIDNFACLCARRMGAAEFIDISEAKGYGEDVCSYARCELGAVHSQGKKTMPIGPRPMPDFLQGLTMCADGMKWFAEEARLLDVPVLDIDTPYIPDDAGPEVIHEAIKYVYEQLLEQIRFLEELTGRSFDFERLQEVIDIVGRAGRLWKEIVELGKNVPAPITTFDCNVNVGVFVWQRGYPQLVDYLQEMKEEVEERVAQGVSAIGDEKYRVLFDGIPPYYAMGVIPRTLASLNTVAVTPNQYMVQWVDTYSKYDAENPLWSIAEAQATIDPNRGTRYRAERYKQRLRDYSAQGIIAHGLRSCSLWRADQLTVMQIIRQETGVPFIVIHSDMVDHRQFSEEEVVSQLESFVEQLAG